MAFATEITIGTGSKMSANYQSNEFSVSLTYKLERGDIDLARLAEEKAAEVESLHAVMRRRILQSRAQIAGESASDSKSHSNPKSAVNGAATSQVPTSPQIALTTAPAPSTRRDPAITEAQKRVTAKLLERAGLTDNELENLLSCRFGRRTVAELTQRQGRMLITDLQRRIQRINIQTDNDANA